MGSSPAAPLAAANMVNELLGTTPAQRPRPAQHSVGEPYAAEDAQHEERIQLVRLDVLY